MVNIARINVNNTNRAWMSYLRVVLKAACHGVSRINAFGAKSLLSQYVLSSNAAQLMQTMTSMMIIMPSRGCR
jgi:hypothetical protein